MNVAAEFIASGFSTKSDGMIGPGPEGVDSFDAVLVCHIQWDVTLGEIADQAGRVDGMGAEELDHSNLSGFDRGGALWHVFGERFAANMAGELAYSGTIVPDTEVDERPTDADAEVIPPVEFPVDFKGRGLFEPVGKHREIPIMRSGNSFGLVAERGEKVYDVDGIDFF
jgi:hypothetical protein